MKRVLFLSLMMTVVLGTVCAQTNDDLYFIPKKKAATTATSAGTVTSEPTAKKVSVTAVGVRDDGETATVEVDRPLTMDEDTYNRRGVRSYIDDEGNYVQEAEVEDLALRVRTVDGDTLYYRVDSLIVNQEDDGWVYGFNGDAEDYEYAETCCASAGRYPHPLRLHQGYGGRRP